MPPLPAYWNMFCVQTARAMLRVRLNMACNEGAARSRPITPKQLDGQHHAVDRKGRIDDRTLRACFLCDEINGQPGVFESASLYPICWLNCPHPARMVFCREPPEAVTMLPVELSRSDEAILQSPQPPLFDQSEMWAVMMLCTSSVSFPVQPQMAAPL